MNCALIEHVVQPKRENVCKPWKGSNGKPSFCGKRDFKINVRDRTITCPKRQVETFEPGQIVEFDPEKAATTSLSSPRCVWCVTR